MASGNSTCASCGKTDSLKLCARCKQVSYCSPQCQKTNWTQHKKDCRFTVVTTVSNELANDALSLLRGLLDPPSTIATVDTPTSGVMTKAFNTAEIRMAVISLLPAKALLTTQGVCRSWYRTIALETTL